eukprot:4743890-Lingulodinium_polyedra.AAC.1
MDVSLSSGCSFSRRDLKQSARCLRLQVFDAHATRFLSQDSRVFPGTVCNAWYSVHECTISGAMQTAPDRL